MQHHPNLVRSEDTSLLVRAAKASGGEVALPRQESYPNITIPDPSSYDTLPYAAVGKLFFTKKGGSISTCSAGFAGGGDLIITAAHCVLTTNGDWNDDFIFVRSYGTEHQEIFGIGCAAVPAQWGELEGNPALDYDVAFLKAIRKTGQGSLGISNGIPPDEMLLVGYANSYFNGRVMLNLTSSVFYSPQGRLGARDNPLGHGSSGTPWVGRSTVYSLSSYFVESENDVMWGPRFTRGTIELMKYVRNGCED